LSSELDIPEGHFSVPEFRQMTGRHVDTIRAKLKAGGLEPLKLGRRRLYFAPEALPLIMDEGHRTLDAEKARLAHERADALAAQNAALREWLVPFRGTAKFVRLLYARACARILDVAAKAAPEAHRAKSVAGTENVLRSHLAAAVDALGRIEPGDLLGKGAHAR